MAVRGLPMCRLLYTTRHIDGHASEGTDAPDETQDCRLQVLRRSDHGDLSQQPHGRRRPERLRQIQHHRCRALGDGRDLRQASARRVHGGRDLQRLRGAQAPGGGSVEMVFDNSEGKIGGAYANYNEVALRRAVSRDGTSDYFINGIKVRRKDITQLFLGTGLGTRSYAIIEQGMISRVIEARPDDLRAFLEEAAGISRYKERRRETESRIAQTRENLDRLNDLREEVEKQIRHLQRQAATARRYQALKEEERKLQAELFALRLQGLDVEAGVRDAAAAHCETAMQAVLADLREAEAQIERIRVDQSAKAEALSAIQARFYGAGAEVTRIEQSIQHARELRQRQTRDLEQAQAQVQELTGHRSATAVSSRRCDSELETMVPGLDWRTPRSASASALLERCEQALAAWQRASDAHAQAVALGQRETQVERARIEQLENQQRRLLQQRSARRRSTRALRTIAAGGRLETLSPQADRRATPARRRAPSLRSCSQSCRSPASASANRLRRSMRLRARWQQALGRRYRPKRCSRPRSARCREKSRSG